MLKNFVQSLFGILSILVLFRLWFLALNKLWRKIEKAFSRHHPD